MTPETQAIQNDDTANPGMLWVLDGETLWKAKAGAANMACADCHNDARASMKGVAARYPRFRQNTRSSRQSGAARQSVPRTKSTGVPPCL